MTPLSHLKRIVPVLVLLGATAMVSSAQTYTTLYNFAYNVGDGPSALVQGVDGNYYGTTEAGGSLGYGTVFMVTPGGALTTVYTFTNGSDGAYPFPSAGLALGSDGNFYGSTYASGASHAGTIFKVTPSGTLTTIHTFSITDGTYPSTALVLGGDGNFYGTTAAGGSADGGTVFQMTPSGTLTTLYDFSSPPGLFGYPSALVEGMDGNFYGTIQNDNFVFKITPSGTLTVLYNFCSQPNCADGDLPLAGLAQDSNGNFYGTTYEGGANDNGTVFQITPGGSLTTLHSFTKNVDGFEPSVGLIAATDGNLYGTTALGGPNGSAGTIFEITPGGTFTTLYDYCFGCTEYDNFFYPQQLTQGTDGTFYGTTEADNEPTSFGTVFSLATGLSPFVTTVPLAGPVGQPVIILGNNLSSATSVSFNGVAATFTVVSSTEITTTVPTGATTGPVAVITSAGTLDSNPNFQVTQATLQATTSAVTATPNPAANGQSVTITATVTPAISGIPTGAVTFYDGATVLGSAQLAWNGQLDQAVYTTSQLPLGAQSLTAVYGGDSNFLGSTSSAYIEEVLTPTTTSLTSSPNPSLSGQAVTFTATVTTSGASTPTGTVSFYDGASLLGSQALGANSQATYATSALASGAQSITATYSGDQNFAGSTSSVFTQNVDTYILSPSATSLNFGSQAVGSTVTLTLTYQIGTSVNLSLTAYTQGATGLDFTISSNGTTCAGNQTAPGSCTVAIAFGPAAPGLRMGAITVTDSISGDRFTSTLEGVGTGSALAFGTDSFGPDTLTTLNAPPGGYNDPTGVAVDGAGDVFVADHNNNRIVEIAANGGAATPLNALTGLSDPESVAVDGAGNLYVTDSGNNRILQLPYLGNGAYAASPVTVPITTSPGLSSPEGVAVDGLGDVFIVDTGNNQALEVPYLGNGQWGPTATLATGMNNPFSIAVDANNNVYVGENGGENLWEIPYAGGNYGPQQVLMTIPVNMYGMAVDAAGDLYVTNTFGYAVIDIPPGCNNSNCWINVFNLSYPSGVAVDSKGDIFIANSGAAQVLEAQQSLPPSFVFPLTQSGSASAPQSVTVQNIGNQPVNSVAPGFSISANFVDVGPNSISSSLPDCMADFTSHPPALAPGAVCDLSIAFQPTASGNLIGAAVFTDDALNNSAASQSIALSGTGAGLPLTTTTLTSSPNPSVQDKTVKFTATVSPQSGAGSPTGKVQFYSGGGLLATKILSSGVATFSTSTLPPGTNGISAVYEGSTSYNGSTSATLNQFVQAATTTTIASSPNPSVYGENVVFTATVSSSSGAPPDGENITFKEGSTVLGTGTLSGGAASATISTIAVGTADIQAEYGGDSNFAASTGSVSQTVDQASSTTGLRIVPNPSNAGQTVTFIASVTGAYSGTVTGSVTINYCPSANVCLVPYVIGTGNLKGGILELTAVNLPLSSYSWAVYAGSKDFATSTSSQVTQTVMQSSTTTVVTSSKNPSTGGQTTTFTATVTAEDGYTPTGSVTFTDTFNNQTTPLCTDNLNSKGVATCKIQLAEGTHDITATFVDNPWMDFAGSYATLTQTVNP
jgi:large repetitive protein